VLKHGSAPSGSTIMILPGFPFCDVLQDEVPFDGFCQDKIAIKIFFIFFIILIFCISILVKSRRNVNYGLFWALTRALISMSVADYFRADKIFSGYEHFFSKKV
jgi:hypothetical protein